RYQRVVPVRIQPFRYDPVTRTVSAVTSATVRVDFVSPRGRPLATRSARAAFPAGTEPGPLDDRHWEGLYRAALLNYEAARDFRAAPIRRSRTTAAVSGRARSF